MSEELKQYLTKLAEGEMEEFAEAIRCAAMLVVAAWYGVVAWVLLVP